MDSFVQRRAGLHGLQKAGLHHVKAQGGVNLVTLVVHERSKVNQWLNEWLEFLVSTMGLPVLAVSTKQIFAVLDGIAPHTTELHT